MKSWKKNQTNLKNILLSYCFPDFNFQKTLILISRFSKATALHKRTQKSWWTRWAWTSNLLWQQRPTAFWAALGRVSPTGWAKWSFITGHTNLGKSKSSQQCLKKEHYLFKTLLTCNSLSCSFFLIHVFPWVCGSIKRGYLVALVTIIPFWIERSSPGSPWRFHSLIYRIFKKKKKVVWNKSSLKLLSFR